MNVSNIIKSKNKSRLSQACFLINTLHIMSLQSTMMAKNDEDHLNIAILESRKKLHDLQEQLANPLIDCSVVLQQINETSAKLREEAENLINIKYVKANTLPLQQNIKGNNLIQHVKTLSPKEYVPFKTTKALELRRRFAKPMVYNKPLPKLKRSELLLPAIELLRRGIVSESDDLSIVVPAVSTSLYKGNYSSFSQDLHLDFRGAAAEYHRRREKQILEEELAQRELASTQIENMHSTEKPQDEVAEEDSTAEHISPKEPETKPSSKNPRIYEELQDEFAFHTLLIVHGKIQRDTPDFESFERTNTKRWANINHVLLAIERFCMLYGIQFAEIDGRKLSEVAGLKVLTDDEVGMCLVGIDELIKKRHDAAANIIKRAWTRYRAVLNAKQSKIEFQAATRIQQFWRQVKSRNEIINHVHNRIQSVDFRAAELAKSLHSQYKKIESSSHVIVHIITTPQDLVRVFDLMFSNIELILVCAQLPPPHIWSEFMEFLAMCGIQGVNERAHFIVLRDLRTISGTSNRLLFDMRSVNQVKRLICGRDSYIVPHPDWSSERRLSTDINVPIFGVTDTTPFASRNGVRHIFNEARIVSTISSKEHRSVTGLLEEMHDLMINNKGMKRWIIHLGYSSGDESVAWFDSNNEFLRQDVDLLDLLKKNLHSKQSPTRFLSMIPLIGATVEAVPTNIRSYPSVSLLLTGNEIRVLGTYERVSHSPFRFTASVVPAVSVDPHKLMTHGKQVGSALLKNNVIGYVNADFFSYLKEDGSENLVGFNIRVNCYPTVVNIMNATLCCGFDIHSGQFKLLKGLRTDANQKVVRYAVVHNGLTHPGFEKVTLADVKKELFSQGIMFDLLHRIGFKVMFYDAPYMGKNSAICSNTSIDTALSHLERSYSVLQKALSAKVGTDGDSSLARALQGIRQFRSLVLK